MHIPKPKHICFIDHSWHWALACERKLALRRAEEGYLKPSQKHRTTVVRLYNSFQMLQPVIRTPHYLIHLEASWPESHVFNCSVPATIVKLQQSKQWGTSSVWFFSSSQTRSCDCLKLICQHPFPAYILRARGKQSITIKSVWQLCPNESKVKTAERCSPMSPQTKAKELTGRKTQMDPPGPSRPRKELMKRCCVHKSLTFGILGAFSLVKVTGYVVLSEWNCWRGVFVWYQMGICHRASLPVSPPVCLICILIYCINLINRMDQFPSISG